MLKDKSNSETYKTIAENMKAIIAEFEAEAEAEPDALRQPEHQAIIEKAKAFIKKQEQYQEDGKKHSDYFETLKRSGEHQARQAQLEGAVFQGISAVRTLLKDGNISTADKTTLLSAAFRQNKPEIIQFLIDNKATLDTKAQKSLLEDLFNLNKLSYGVVQILLKNNLLDQENKDFALEKTMQPSWDKAKYCYAGFFKDANTDSKFKLLSKELIDKIAKTTVEINKQSNQENTTEVKPKISRG